MIDPSAGELVQTGFNTFVLTVPIRWFYALNSLNTYDMTRECTVKYTFHSQVAGKYKEVIEKADVAYHVKPQPPYSFNPIFDTNNAPLGLQGPIQAEFVRGNYSGLRPTTTYQALLNTQYYTNWANQPTRSFTLTNFEMDLQTGSAPRLATSGDSIRFTETAYRFSFVGNGDRSVNRDAAYPADINYGLGKAKENGCTFYFEFLLGDQGPYFSGRNVIPGWPGEGAPTNVTNTNGFAGCRPYNNGAPTGCIPIVYHFPQSELRLVIYCAVIGTEHALLAGQSNRLSFNVIVCDNDYVYFHRGFIDKGLNPALALGIRSIGLFVTLGMGNGLSATLPRMRPNLVNVHFFYRGEFCSTFRSADSTVATTPCLSTPFQSTTYAWTHPWMSGSPVPPGLTSTNYECSPTAELNFYARNSTHEEVVILTGDIPMIFPAGNNYNNLYTILQKADLRGEAGSSFFPGSFGNIPWLSLRRTVMLRNVLLNLSEMETIYRSTYVNPAAANLYTTQISQAFQRGTLSLWRWANFDAFYANKIVDIDFRYRDNEREYADNVDRPPGSVRFTVGNNYNESAIAEPNLAVIDHRQGGFLSQNKSTSLTQTMQLSELPSKLELHIVHESNDTNLDFDYGDEIYVTRPTVEIDLEVKG